MSWQGVLQTNEELYQLHKVPATYVAGHAIGIIAIDLKYPKMPGNVVNATTFTYPVLYKKVTFDIELLFAGAKELEREIIAAAKELEREGVRAVIGACGYFAHYQKQVAEALSIPVFLSSLCQIPMAKMGLKESQKILVLAANGEQLNNTLFQKLGISPSDCVVLDVGSLDSFAPIRWGKEELDHKKLSEELVDITILILQKRTDIGAILLECSDLPPYASEIQRASGLPVFDFISLINWVEHAVVQKRYYGYF